MSGGSHNYLFERYIEDRSLGETMNDLEGIIASMVEHAAHDPALSAQLAPPLDATRQVHAALEAAVAAWNEARGQLADVWKAVEWVDSADWGRDRLGVAGAAYNVLRAVDGLTSRQRACLAAMAAVWPGSSPQDLAVALDVSERSVVQTAGLLVRRGLASREFRLGLVHYRRLEASGG